MGHSFDMLTFDFLLKLPQPVTGLFLHLSVILFTCGVSVQGVSVWGSLFRGVSVRGSLSRGSLSRGDLCQGVHSCFDNMWFLG